MIARVRQLLLAAADAYIEHKVAPPGLDTPSCYGVRAGAVILPEDLDWLEGIQELLPAFVDHPELDLSQEFGLSS